MKLKFAASWITRWILLWAALSLPVWAQNQMRTPAAPKSKAETSPPIRQAPSRVVSADVTARLQAAAAATAQAAHDPIAKYNPSNRRSRRAAAGDRP